jgi:diacylglycerol kinase family enzyme
LIAKDIKIKTSKRQKVELDGEVRLQTPLTASVEADAVLVRYEK